MKILHSEDILKKLRRKEHLNTLLSFYHKIAFTFLVEVLFLCPEHDRKRLFFVAVNHIKFNERRQKDVYVKEPKTKEQGRN